MSTHKAHPPIDFRQSAKHHSQSPEHFYMEIVQDPSDWKNPIDCTVQFRSQHNDNDRIDIIVAIENAVSHFTGTVATTEFISEDVLQVVAIGYRNGPCGP